MKWLTVLCATLFLGVGMLAGLSQAALEGRSYPEQIVFRGKGKLGSVVFSHKTHEEQGIKCQMCHHASGDDGKCSKCHAADPKIPRTQDAFHLICVGCHKHKNIDVSCESCHKN